MTTSFAVPLVTPEAWELIHTWRSNYTVRFQVIIQAALVCCEGEDVWPIAGRAVAADRLPQPPPIDLYAADITDRTDAANACPWDTQQRLQYALKLCLPNAQSHGCNVCIFISSFLPCAPSVSYILQSRHWKHFVLFSLFQLTLNLVDTQSQHSRPLYYFKSQKYWTMNP